MRGGVYIVNNAGGQQFGECHRRNEVMLRESALCVGNGIEALTEEKSSGNMQSLASVMEADWHRIRR